MTVIMETFSEKFKGQLKALLQLWLKEKGEYEEFHITPTNLLLSDAERIFSIDFKTILDYDEQSEIVHRCKIDLHHLTNYEYQRPNYLGGNEDELLRKLTRMIRQTTFRQKSVHERLEVYYYLGELLSLRGWTKKDYGILQEQVGQRFAKDVKKTSRRVYELFAIRGVQCLTKVAYICPTCLTKMSEGDFYDELLPEARRIMRETL
ncbi:hypothetical protein GLOIN_2v1762086 [Rhizophagus irregularis DAOM 181602=DAOM 197198]|uniref:Uncharacterized protein n=1 Tax=Rhizophagus irregularis (strain DAOM 181602 / DAOM 197198 / MUCL 43194) TaxID=747089 RepID=A0A2P4QYF9_RHIID|nr:hypothetical protein GLOIN_2v1762086 [Rhizophagus irregularis DAOM 181602=DAOM 197198]POG82686.1 hypothetical protein GLOIN_2v1762086 [Rhizophagus irregularis DAOM 181602=DAOM 197198]|eukprot:XP_025189552.1 hypothetical protein GLOIN_2v1762086 [Rhizophagus irregularis DAOM 181602=DAOM 197198]